MRQSCSCFVLSWHLHALSISIYYAFILFARAALHIYFSFSAYLSLLVFVFAVKVFSVCRFCIRFSLYSCFAYFCLLMCTFFLFPLCFLARSFVPCLAVCFSIFVSFSFVGVRVFCTRWQVPSFINAILLSFGVEAPAVTKQMAARLQLLAAPGGCLCLSVPIRSIEQFVYIRQ